MFIPSEVTRFRNFAAHLSCSSRPNDHMHRSRREVGKLKLVCEEKQIGKQWHERNLENDVKNKMLGAAKTPLGVVMFVNYT